jgi:hypothetical protein
LWGDVSRRADVASACKPFFSHFLFRAVEDGKIESVDERAVRWEPRLKQINRELGFKDAAPCATLPVSACSICARETGTASN